jgi:LPXTG-site transpeptidase (sortase) family protein
MFFSAKKRQRSKSSSRLPGLLIGLGLFLLAVGSGIFFYTFSPVISLEIRYFFQRPQAQTQKTIIRPVDEQFGLVIPKIGANARVIPEVDPFDPQLYQAKLTQGVAHAKGSGYPGQPGNIFIFSHSSVNFFEANRYNSIFYLLHQLKPGDEIYLYYQRVRYKYLVKEVKIVAPDQVSYLSHPASEFSLTLMTCWPPGTTAKRLLVIASPA